MDEPTVIAARYRLDEVLGRGAFGITYAAEDLRSGARVAVKQLDLRHVGDWKAIELFEREAQVLEQLDHPQIPNYVEFLPIEADSAGYLVQELAPGRSLAARLEAGETFDEAGIRAIAAQLLGILVYLGGRFPPVVHRDIKPSNVLMADDGRCYLVDFGSVRNAVETADAGGSTVAGTFGYMAPEQLHGEAQASADLYGLGATLIHLLTGVEPSLLPRKRLKIDFRAQLRLNEELAAFIDRLIEPVPDDRFESAQAALDALRTGTNDALAPAAPLPSSPGARDIASAIAKQQAQAQAQAQAARTLAEQRAVEVARTQTPRAQLRVDDEGFTLAIAPRPFLFRFAVQLPAPLFLTVNPGFAIAGGHPFAGPHWPIFADNGVARFIVWGLLLMGISALIAHRRGHTVHLRVAGDHFLAWHRSPDQPLAMGELRSLHISPAAELGPNGRGTASIRAGDHISNFGGLSSLDLERVREAKQLLDDRRELRSR